MDNGINEHIKNKNDLILGITRLVKEHQLKEKHLIEYSFVIYDPDNRLDEIITVTNVSNHTSLIRMHKSLHIILSSSNSVNEVKQQ